MARKKKQTQQKVEFPQKFNLFSVDLSLRRPGAAIITIENNKITNLITSSLDRKSSKQTHGQLLTDIGDWLTELMRQNLKEQNTFFIRQKAFNSRAAQSQIGIFKVVGLTDLLVQAYKDGLEWNELYPVTVKKQLTDNGKADKTVVAEYVKKYIGEWKFQCDDESDAVAVGIAWLLQHDGIERVKEGDDAIENTGQQVESIQGNEVCELQQ